MVGVSVRHQDAPQLARTPAERFDIRQDAAAVPGQARIHQRERLADYQIRPRPARARRHVNAVQNLHLRKAFRSENRPARRHPFFKYNNAKPRGRFA